MVARNWILMSLAGVALAAPACALVLGAEELPQGAGGAGTSSTSGGTTSTRTSGTTTGSTTGSQTGASTSSTSSSSAGGACAKTTTCGDCVACMGTGSCKTEAAACPDGSTGPCSWYLQCVVQCPEDKNFAACAVGDGGCNGTTVTDMTYVDLVDCACMGCKAQCPELCK